MNIQYILYLWYLGVFEADKNEKQNKILKKFELKEIKKDLSKIN